MTKILITGGAGFIPGSLAAKLAENPDNFVVLVDNFITGKKRNIPKGNNIRFIKCDVNVHLDIAPVLTSHRFDYVFHYAALVGVKRTLANPSMVLEDLQGIKNILTLSKNTGVKRVFYSSSSEVYGEPLCSPQTEEYRGNVNTLGIRSCYDEGKRIAETLMMDFHRKYNVDTRIARIFNTYGPQMDKTDGRVISNFINQSLRHENITIYGDGSQTRSFCYITDQVNGLVKLMNSDCTSPINIGNPNELTVKQVAEKIIELNQSQSKLLYLPLPKDDPTNRKPDITKANMILNWYPHVNFEEGLLLTIDYFNR